MHALPQDAAAQFSQAYEQYSNAIIHHCMAQGLGRHEAEEFTQDAFLKTWEYMSSGHVVVNLRVFLYKVAGNLIIDSRRRSNGKDSVSLDELQEKGVDLESEPDGRTAERMQAKMDVLQMLLGLKKKEYLLLAMRYVQGLTPTDIAAQTGEAPNTVAVQLHRAMRKLVRDVSQQHKAPYLRRESEYRS